MNYIGQFKFVSWHGRLLQATTSGEMRATQDIANVGEEERWNVFVLESGKIALQNYRTNRWLCAEPNGKAICDRVSLNEWEQWTLYKAGDGVRVALRSHHNTWLCAAPPDHNEGFGSNVIANRAALGEWERFEMAPSGHEPIKNQSWWNDAYNAFKIVEQAAPIIIKVVGG